MDVLKSLFNVATGLVKETAKLRSLNKEDVAKLIKTNLELHQQLVAVLGSYSAADMKRWYVDEVKFKMAKDKSSAKTIYDSFYKQLNGKALKIERDKHFGSLEKANEDFIGILKEINKNLDNLFDSKSVTIYESRISHIAVLGLIRQSDMVLNFTMYLYTYMSRVSSASTSSIPKYREKYLSENVIKVARITSLLLDKKGSYNFMQEVNGMRRNQTDTVLGATGTFDFQAYTNISKISIGVLDTLASALSYINIFAIGLDMWDTYQISKNERNKETKEWLENHVTLLRMDLAGMDHSSPEYQRTINIINAYDDKISDYDKKILAFEQGE